MSALQIPEYRTQRQREQLSPLFENKKKLLFYLDVKELSYLVSWLNSEPFVTSILLAKLGKVNTR